MTIDFPAYTPRKDARWQEVQYRALPFADDRLDHYCDALSSIYGNGRSDFVAFEASNRDDFLSAYQFHSCSIREPVESAYERWKGSVQEAKTLATEAVSAIRAIAPDRPWSPFLVRGPWCSYFHDIAWDYTFAVQFPYDARWFLLCATDTD